jgi:DNA polymerase-3 subunit beta
MGSHFQIVMQDTVEFPHVPTLEGDPDFTIENGTLRHLIDWTVFAAARESTRYAINGVLWELDGDRLTLAATDGRRLSIARGQLSARNTDSTSQAIVPGRALSLFARLSADEDAPVGVKLAANQMLFKVGGATVSTVLVEGHFPKYQDVVPVDCDRVVELDTVEFHGALKRAALLTNEESKGVRLSFGEDSLTLSSRAPEQGEATISLEVSYRGEPTEIGFNPVFLSDVLRVTHTDRVSFAFKEANRPGIVRMGDDFVHVVMPVNLSSG